MREGSLWLLRLLPGSQYHEGLRPGMLLTAECCWSETRRGGGSRRNGRRCMFDSRRIIVSDCDSSVG